MFHCPPTCLTVIQSCLIREEQVVWTQLLPTSRRLETEGCCGCLEVRVLLLEEGALRLGQGQCLRRQRIAVGKFWGLNVGVRVLRRQQRWMVQLATQSRVHHGSALRAE